MKIDHNIPLPQDQRHTSRPKNQNSGRPGSYPFAKMAVGDSILVDGESASCSKCPAYNAAKSWGRDKGVEFVGRRWADGKVRIWRIE